jgi:hypothetical protein
MALASDIMGLGVPAAQARHMSIGGTGPTSAAAAGTTWATATLIRNNQYFISVTTGQDGAAGLALPTAPLPTDQYIVNNRSQTIMVVFAPVGVVISIGGTATSYAALATHATHIFYPISSSAWCAVKSG